MHSFLSKKYRKGYKQDNIKENYGKILTIIMPIIPHFASECLKMIESDTIWPDYDEKVIMKIKLIL